MAWEMVIKPSETAHGYDMSIQRQILNKIRYEEV